MRSVFMSVYKVNNWGKIEPTYYKLIDIEINGTIRWRRRTAIYKANIVQIDFALKMLQLKTFFTNNMTPKREKGE